MTDFYTYTAIDLATDAIRLFRLLPTSAAEKGDTKIIRCEIFETFLHQVEGVPYEALSYTWGDATHKHEIELNGKTHLVTSNLNQALRDLRLDDEDRVLWVDAICINQQDDRERGHQVGQMTLTYQHAERVLIWLGPGTAHTDALLSWMNRLDQRVIARRDYKRNSTEAWLAELVECKGRVQDINDTDCVSWHFKLSNELMDLLPELYKSSWFKRIWILQEAANARSALVIYGRQFVPSRTFTLIPMLMGFKVAQGKQTVLEIMPGPLRASSWWKERRDLEMLITKFAGNSEASDERDKIYALLGMTSDQATPTSFSPDYQVSFEVVVRRTIVYLLSVHGIQVSLDDVPSWGLDQLIDPLSSLCERLFEFATINATENGGQFESLAIAVLPQISSTYLHGGKDVLPPSPTLCYLAQTGMLERLAEAIVSRDDVNVDVSDGLDPPIFIAAKSLHWNIVQVLLQSNKVDVWARSARVPSDLSSNYIIDHAAKNGAVSIMRLIVNSPLTTFKFGDAIRFAFADLLEHCLDHASDKEELSLWLYKPPWQDGLKCTLVSDYLERLPGLRVELDYRDQFASWLLWLSAALGDTTAITWLVSRGVREDVWAVFGSRITFASRSSRNVLRSIRKLTALGNIAPTPLWIAACCRHADAVQLLSDLGANFDISSRRHNITPLAIAIAHNHREVALLLLERGASFKGNSDTVMPPLWLAATQGLDDVVRKLLALGASPAELHPGWISTQPPLPVTICKPSLLTVVASRGHLEVLKALLEHQTYREGPERPLLGNIDLALLTLFQTGTAEGLQCAELLLDCRVDLLGSDGSHDLRVQLESYFHNNNWQFRLYELLTEFRKQNVGKAAVIYQLVIHADSIAQMENITSNLEFLLEAY